MSLQATPGALVDLGSAVLLLALGAFVASVRPRRRANAAFAVFSGAFGAGFLVGNLLTSDDAMFPLAAMVSAAFLSVAAVALLALAALFPGPLPRPRMRLLAPLAAVAGGVTLWHAWFVLAVRDCLAVCQDFGGYLGGPFFFASVEDAVLLAAFVVALLLLPARYAAAQRPGRARVRRQVGLVSAALVLYPGLRAGFDTSAGFAGFSFGPPGSYGPTSGAMQGLAIAAWIAVAGLLWVRNTARAEAEERTAARNLALLHLGLPVLGLVLAMPLGSWPLANNSGALGLARVASVLVLGYAILRYQLLDIDVRLRRTVRAGTVAGVLLGAYIVVSAASQALVEGTAAVWLGIAAAGLLVLAILPLQRLADRAADRALPGRGDSSGLEERRVELYRAALEQAAQGSDARDGSDSRILAELRARLGISEREHAVLEAEVRAASPGVGYEAGKRVLGKYRVERVLGQGGFGRAYLAFDEKVQRRVVLKVARATTPGEARRLLREARLLARLGHPRIVAVHDVEQVGGDVVLVLEYMGGGSLEDRLRAGPLPLPEAAAVMDDVLDALAAAHVEGVVHRDVKPANILLTEQARAKLADFGVARDPGGSGTQSGVTQAAGNPGSVRYMSPEQVRGNTLDPRSDLYSWGVVLFEALTGETYIDFRGRSEFDTRLAILEEPPRLPAPGLPGPLDDLLAACLAKEPDLRPASAGEVRARLAAASVGAGAVDAVEARRR